jgi:CheY-like chemotaxis protein
VRTGQEGLNPFTIMMLTAWDLSKSVVTAAIDSGADDLIARPFSIGQFNRRLKTLVEARKQFVVTSDYVGPDRRKDPARGTTAELIDVPNTLRGKVLDNATSEDFDGAIHAMRTRMDGERLRRLGAQIAVSAEIVMDWALSPEGLFDAAEIDRLRRAAQELQAREAEGAAAGTADLCAGVLKVCDALVGGDCDAEKEANLLKELANGIQVALNPERSAGDLAGEIASTVAGLKSRKAQTAAG